MDHAESRGQDKTRLSQPEAQPPEDLRPRDERYVIVEPPKQGGMGILFKAFDTRLERTVAVKRIRPEFSGDQALVARFVKEAKTLARFRHAGIVQVLELTEDELGPYIVMEWIDGESLAEIEKCHGPFHPSQAVEIIQRVAEGLQAAHQQGAIHRDIKPANILLDRSGQPYLVDFGLVRIESDSRASMAETVTGAMLGTLDFISPEQMKDPRQANELSDLWSLAATLYQMLTGFSVRARDDELLPEELRGVIARALKPRPADRYENVAAFAEALAVAMRGPGLQITVVAADTPPATVAKTALVSRTAENDLAKLLEETTTALGRKHEQAKQLLDEHDYAQAVELLQSIPGSCRDQRLYDDAISRRDRVLELEANVRNAVKELRLEGLRSQLEELQNLLPGRGDIQQLMNQLPRNEVWTFKLPEIDGGIGEVGVIRVKAGDVVSAGAILLEIETDKAIVEVPCPYEGRVASVLVEPGQTVQIGQPLILFQNLNTGTRDGHSSGPSTNHGPLPAGLKSPFRKTQAFSAQEAWAKYLGLGVEVTNSLGMKFRVIPPGTFVMGSPVEKSEGILFWKTVIQQGEQGRSDDETQHTVTISQPKLFGVYPVTQGEWLQVTGKNPAYFQSVSGQDTSRFPVEQVSWDDAQEFLATLNARYSLPGWRYRLPTEAEWEYACRAGTVTPFSFGSELNGRQANCDGNYPFPGGTTTGPYLERPSVVGSYVANPFGLYDLHGNVWEWCDDWYGEYDVSGLQDPTGPSSGSSRVLRGGSWGYLAVYCRSARRYLSDPSLRNSFIGLRVVSELV